MANAIIYVDNVNGNNGNSGLTEALAVADIPTALTKITGGGNTIYVQAGSNYVLTSTITFTAALKGDITDGRNRLVGYTTTPGADDGRPTITSATNSVTLFTLNDNDFWEFKHLNLTHTAATRGATFAFSVSASSPLIFTDIIIDGCSVVFGNFSSQSYYFIGCEIKNCTTTGAVLGGSNGGLLYFNGCDFHDNVGDVTRGGSFGSGYSVIAIRTIFDTNAMAIHTSTAGATPVILEIYDCIFVDHTSHAIEIDTTSSTVQLNMVNNIFFNNAGWGINNLQGAGVDAWMRANRNNAFGTNSSGAYTGIAAGIGEITLTPSADPFTNKTNRDFSLNPAGTDYALLKAKAFPLQNLAGTTLNYRDVGAFQHIDPTTKPFTPQAFMGGFRH